MRRVSLIAGLLALVSLLAPVGEADAAPKSLTVKFSGRITLWDDVTRLNHPTNPAQPVGIYAPTSSAPACGGGLCPEPPNGRVDWIYDTERHPANQATCVVAHSTAGAAARVNGTGVGTCSVRADGILVDGIGGLGPYCGFSRGPLHLEVTVNGVTETLLGSSTQHAGPVLIWQVSGSSQPGQVGRATLELVTARGNCGLDEADGYTPATEFDVSGTVTWTATL